MIPAWSYESICQKLTRAFRKERYHGNVRMVGLLFAQPGRLLVDSEIIPSLNYYHHRSGDHIDFFCAGYGIDEGDDYRPVGNNWKYNACKFNDFRKKIEGMTSWEYSGQTDLILTNARYDPEMRTGYLDFRSSIVCDLETMKQVNAIQSAGEFFERIFRFAENAEGNDPTWGFGDRMCVNVAGSAFKRLILSFIPRRVGDDLNRLEQFIVRDIGPSPSLANDNFLQ
jgi:hypothetical protein